MGRYLFRRVLQAIVTLWLVATAVFFLVRLTGDPAGLIAGENSTPEQIAALRAALGLDRPLHVQYVSFLMDAVRGDFGYSFIQHKPAHELVFERLPATALLAVTAFAVGMSLAFGIGLSLQLARNPRATSIVMWLVYARQSLPSFWFGLLLILLFAVTLGWLPTMGSGTWRHLILPALTLATFELALYLRMLNAGFGEHLSEDYVRTARAKGLSERWVIARHALPNVLAPIIALAGVNFGVLLSGTVITEIVFSWPGVGRLIIQAVFVRDYSVIQAAMLLVAGVFVVLNLIVDLMNAYVDPRIRLR